MTTDWYAVSGKAHERTFAHECLISSLRHEWERELAAIWRLESDVNNGAYLQFLGNWGRENYEYASQALHKIGALKMAEITNTCQRLVDDHVDCSNRSSTQLHDDLPDDIVDRIYKLSYEFMNYPDDVATLGVTYYLPHLKAD
jgi:Domain of unknown function (DUF4375)